MFFRLPWLAIIMLLLELWIIDEISLSVFGVMVSKWDMQPIWHSFNNVHVPCYVMLMCYFVPSFQQAYICAKIIAIVIQYLLGIDSWSIHLTIVSLIVIMPVTFIGPVQPVGLIAGLWISNCVKVSCSTKVMIRIIRLICFCLCIF